MGVYGAPPAPHVCLLIGSKWSHKEDPQMVVFKYSLCEPSLLLSWRRMAMKLQAPEGGSLASATPSLPRSHSAVPLGGLAPDDGSPGALTPELPSHVSPTELWAQSQHCSSSRTLGFGSRAPTRHLSYRDVRLFFLGGGCGGATVTEGVAFSEKVPRSLKISLCSIVRHPPSPPTGA